MRVVTKDDIRVYYNDVDLDDELCKINQEYSQNIMRLVKGMFFTCIVGILFTTNSSLLCIYVNAVIVFMSVYTLFSIISSCYYRLKLHLAVSCIKSREEFLNINLSGEMALSIKKKGLLHYIILNVGGQDHRLTTLRECVFETTSIGILITPQNVYIGKGDDSRGYVN